jgi:hypothetical protein
MEKPRRLALIGEIVVETTKFESQAMANLEIAGVECQLGTLAGYTVEKSGQGARPGETRL